ncbi:MAG TPA: ABC transporter substrate-binding protein, partial [Chloroflexota bacterium]|nr:ABC transporter substrate-binding protein [Chloroflexota bacterium]
MDQLRVLVPTPAASNAICRLAEREGLYAKHGLEAEVRVVGDSSALLREARNGGACVFYLAAAAVVEAALDGAELVLFVGAVNRPFHSIVCHPEIASAEDLSGKRVGLRTFQTTAGVWMRGILADDYRVDLASISWHTQDEEAMPWEPPDWLQVQQ